MSCKKDSLNNGGNSIYYQDFKIDLNGIDQPKMRKKGSNWSRFSTTKSLTTYTKIENEWIGNKLEFLFYYGMNGGTSKLEIDTRIWIVLNCLATITIELAWHLICDDKV